MSILDKLNKDLLKTSKRFVRANEKACKIYSKLSNQRDVARSKPFADLLSAEIDAYTRLTVAANEYFKIQAVHTQNDNEIHTRIIELNANVDVDDLQKVYAISNTIPISNSIKIYMKAISRDYKDWKLINKMLVELSLDVVVGNIPIVSSIKSIINQITQAISVFKECMKDGTDYSKLDYELYKMEIHTTIMDNAEKLFLYQSRTLEDAIAFPSQDLRECYNKIINEKELCQ